MSDIHFHVDTSAAVSRFHAMSEKAADMTEALSEFVPFFHSTMAAQFGTEGDYLGAPWAQLSDTYATWKNGVAPGAKILELTGAMMRSFTSSDAPGSIVEIGPDFVTVGSKDPKAGFHQSGTSNMPARPIIAGTQDVLAVGLARILSNHLSGSDLTAVDADE